MKSHNINTQSGEPAAQQPEHEGMSRGEWTEAARRVYLAAGDDEATAKECASYLWSEQDHLNCELECPYEAALADIEGRPAEEAAQQPVAVQHIHVTEEMHVAAVKVLHRANGLGGLPQRMMDAMLAAAPQAPSREPLTPEQVIAMWRRSPHRHVQEHADPYLAGFRDGERSGLYGITKEGGAA